MTKSDNPANSAGHVAPAWHGGRRMTLLPTIDTLAVVLALAVAVVAGWPTYQHISYVVCVAVASVLAGALAALCTRRWRLRARWVWLLSAGVYLVAVIPVAINSALWNFPANLSYGLREAILAPVTAWKSLVTLDLPVGAFGTVLVPAFIVFLVAVLWLVLLQLRQPHLVGWRIVAVAIPMVFVIATGPAVSSRATSWMQWQMVQPREAILGVTWALVIVLWLSSRQYFAKPRVKSITTDGRSRRRMLVLPATRMLAAVVTLALGAVIAVGYAPTWIPDRVVARSLMDPQVMQPPSQSPLSTYRMFFAGTDLDRVLFTIEGEELPERLRIATMPSYRGDVFTAVDPDDPSSDFRRLAYRIPNVEGKQLDLTVTVGQYQGPWVPTPGQPVQVRFTGDSARELASQLYVSRMTTGAIVMTPRGNDLVGLVPGDMYDLTVAIPEVSGTSGVSPRANAMWTEDELPAMYNWLDSLDITMNSIGDVQAAVDQMTWASYLSHSLVDPAQTYGQLAGTWIDLVDSDGYRFEPSYAGHNLRTIDEQIFHRLLDPTIRRCAGPDDNHCAAVVGDDEQFAVAAALIGQAAGFPARVVLGATIDPGGVVRAHDVRAWAELQSLDGRWTPIEATARTDNAFDDTQTQPTPNQYSNPVKRDLASQLPPPDVRSQSGGSSAPSATDPTEGPISSAGWGKAATMAGISLGALVLITSPIWVVLLIKLLRLRRRRAGMAEDRITGGWDEFADRAVDMGKPRVWARTRMESAEVYGGVHGTELAIRADMAVFADRDPTTQEAVDYWNLLQAELTKRRAVMSRWQRLRAKISWRFLTEKSSQRDAEDTEENSRWYV